MVARGGFEPPTPGLWVLCSNQLSYPDIQSLRSSYSHNITTISNPILSYDGFCVHIFSVLSCTKNWFKIESRFFQAATGGKVIARETIKGYKKDILTKIHGGGAWNRKRKLLDKQKKGKAKAKQFGEIEIPQEAFIWVLKVNKDHFLTKIQN